MYRCHIIKIEDMTLLIKTPSKMTRVKVFHLISEQRTVRAWNTVVCNAAMIVKARD